MLFVHPLCDAFRNESVRDAFGEEGTTSWYGDVVTPVTTCGVFVVPSKYVKPHGDAPVKLIDNVSNG